MKAGGDLLIVDVEPEAFGTERGGCLEAAGLQCRLDRLPRAREVLHLPLQLLELGGSGLVVGIPLQRLAKHPHRLVAQPHSD